MRNIILALIATSVGIAFPAAGAAAGYDTPEEYADLFDRFRAITPEEAVKMVSVMGYTIGENSAGSVILEPIAIKSTDGLPGYYWILSLKTDDTYVREAAENAISMANAENGFEPYEFAKECAVVKEHYEDFCTFYVNAWTWYGEVGYNSSNMVAQIVNEFQYYLDLAEELYGKGNLVRAWFYAASIRPSSPIVVFETRDGTQRYLYGPTGDVNEIDSGRVQELASAGMDEAYTHFKEYPDAWSGAESRWAETLERVERDAQKENGYYKLRGPSLDLGTDGNKVDNVPDMNMNFRPGSNKCWRFTMASIIAFWSQKYRLKMVEGTNIPAPGENSATTDYGFKVYDTITTWIKGNTEWGHYVIFDEPAFPDAVVDMADEFTASRGFNEDNKNAFYYLCWWLWSGEEKNTTDYVLTHLNWNGIVTSIGEQVPLYSRWDYHPVKQGPHAVPTVGYSGSNTVITWNMIGEEYDPDPQPYPADTGSNHLWGWITEPQRGGIGDPWVTDFEVEKKRKRAELSWRVATARDVKGFKVFRKGPDGVSVPVNSDLLRPCDGDGFQYEFVDEGYVKGSTYVLQLVRYTVDPVPYLVYEWEVQR